MKLLTAALKDSLIAPQVCFISALLIPPDSASRIPLNPPTASSEPFLEPLSNGTNFDILSSLTTAVFAGYLECGGQTGTNLNVDSCQEVLHKILPVTNKLKFRIPLTDPKDVQLPHRYSSCECSYIDKNSVTSI